MTSPVKKFGAAKVLIGVQRLNKRILHWVAGGHQKFWQSYPHVIFQLRDAECPRLRGGCGFLRDRTARRLPFGESTIQDKQIARREPMVIEVEEKAGRHIGAALIVYNDFLSRADAPGLDAPFHFRSQILATTECEHINVDRTGNVLGGVELAKGRVDEDKVVAIEVLCEPFNADEIAFAVFCRQGGLQYGKAAGSEYEKPNSQ